MKMAKAENAFIKAVQTAISKYLSEYNLAITQRDNRMFVLQSEYCRVTIVLEWITVMTSIKSLSKTGEYEYVEKQVDIGWVHKPEDIHDEVDRQFRLLVDVCRTVLSGQIENWPHK